MSAIDMIITCRDCGEAFAFTAADQEFNATYGFTFEPCLCTACVQWGIAHRPAPVAPPPYRARQSVNCDGCGKVTLISYLPRYGKPVYCQDCFTRRR
jgi:CxxC-x17-CxxC domain-containing protein